VPRAALAQRTDRALDAQAHALDDGPSGDVWAG